MNECEHVIELDVGCTIKRRTTMCLGKKKKKNHHVVDRFYIALFSAVEQTHCLSELIMSMLETIAQCNL